MSQHLVPPVHIKKTVRKAKPVTFYIYFFKKNYGTFPTHYSLEWNKADMDLINNLKSNFVCINKQIPKCIIADEYIIVY